ncbi:hypothetical protein [Streptomyces sp. NRRL B-24484]|uniref:hypothetical protein n=1 Tax=Streptomyces sp. NRRL B-24484 TaxID=1463833 RepID=UPI0004C14C5F|nr:hypothetical protein [Streptomyces sp. NRRL B-24484]
MGIGYLLLYAALAVVALWLIAELLLQNRAPVVWRGVALAGFLTVVGGMRLQSVLVIGVGAAAFAAGQFFVTTSVKRGFVAGWSLRRQDGTLPGPLARVPLLSAATGGVAGAEEEALPEPPVVGAVGPVEADPALSAYTEVEEIAADGVYAEPQAYQQEQQVWTQQSVPQQAVHQDVHAQQQAGHGYGWDQQWAAQQQFAQAQYQQQDPYGQQAAWAQQAAYAQYQQDPYAAQQFADQQAQQVQQPQQQGYYYQQGWEYQQQPAVPQQQGQYQQQTWDYQQQG